MAGEQPLTTDHPSGHRRRRSQSPSAAASAAAEPRTILEQHFAARRRICRCHDAARGGCCRFDVRRAPLKVEKWTKRRAAHLIAFYNAHWRSSRTFYLAIGACKVDIPVNDSIFGQGLRPPGRRYGTKLLRPHLLSADIDVPGEQMTGQNSFSKGDSNRASGNAKPLTGVLIGIDSDRNNEEQVPQLQLSSSRDRGGIRSDFFQDSQTGSVAKFSQSFSFP